VNRAGGRSGSLRNIGRIEQWNVGSGATCDGPAAKASDRYSWNEATFADAPKGGGRAPKH